ncbi:MAG: ABC transporter permease [Pseudonocardiaceae bacterium]
MIRLSRLMAVSGNEWRIVRKYQELVILLLIVPLVMMALVSKGIGAVVADVAPEYHAAGADFTVPGFTLMFGFMLIGFLGNGFMGEHGWGTWDRLRASSARPSEVLLGKVLPYAGLSLAQFVLMLTVGWTFLGMHLRGSAIALALLVIASVFLIISVSLAITAFCSSGQQVSSFANLVGIVIGLVGGVFMPVAALPTWVRYMSPLTPQYWAMSGFRKVLAGNGTVTDIGVELLILVGLSVVLFAIAARRFRFDESKRSLV